MQTRSTANNLKATRDTAGKEKTVDNTSQLTTAQDEHCAKSSELSANHLITPQNSTSSHQVFLQDNGIDGLKSTRPPQQSNSLIMSASQSCLRQTSKNEEARGRLFSVGISTQTKSSKNLDYVRLSSNEGITLYCKADTSVPFNFRFLYGDECHPNMRVRVRPEYTEDRYANKPVERCPNHLVKDNTETRNHFVRCEHPQAEYLGIEDAYAVRIPMCESTGFMFTCFSSCSGGINRRPVQLAFILEERNGRMADSCYISLKVCANPLRDASKENGRFEPRMMDSMFAGASLQRKRGNRFTGEIVKRPNFRGYMDETSASWELHLTDIRKARKVLWLLMNEDKFDQMMNMAKEGTVFNEFCTLTPETSIKEWLSRSEIGLSSLSDAFERKSIYTLGDLSRIYRQDTFSHFGFTTEQCNLLNRVFQEWNQMNRAIATGQVSMANGVGSYPHL